MTKPKYTVEQDNQGSRTLWVVKLTRSRKVLSHHVDADEANRTAARYVEEDREEGA